MPIDLPDPSLFHVAVDIEVRWGDLDALAHVNNATYFTYFESARIAWFAHMAPGQPVSLQSVGPIVARASCDFLKPIGFPAVVRVATRARKVGTTSLEMDYLVTDRESAEVHALGAAVLVMFDYRTALKVPIPDELRRRIQALEGVL
jgi:acyl-CoA thioester hydrolase